MSETPIIIRKELEQDHEAIGNIHREAFGGQEGEDVATLVERIRQSDRYVDDFSLVAEDNGEVVGHVLLSYVDLVHPDGEVKQILSLSPLGVSNSQQGKGVGGALVTKALEVAEDRGEPIVTLEGHPGYYPRFGFEPAHEAGVTYPPHVPLEAAMVKKLGSYHESIKGTVTYPEAFDHLPPHDQAKANESTHKTKVDQALVHQFLADQYGVDPETITITADGEGSQAFFFETEAGQKVFRVNSKMDEGFKKDQYAAEHFASDALPIPKIEAIGTLDNGMFYAVSERSPGETLGKKGEKGIEPFIPMLVATADAIHATAPIGTGYGETDLDGNGKFDSWIETLDSWQTSDDDEALKDIPYFEPELWESMHTRAKELYPNLPTDVRQLFHADYGFDNVLADDTKVTGVIDWHSASYGDPLYDVAWLDYWGNGWQADWGQIFRDHYESEGRLPENYNERLNCYKLIIGSGAMAFFAKSNQQDKYEFAKAQLAKIPE